MASRSLATISPGPRTMFGRLATILFLLLATAWVALLNGQPVFMPDTTNYVRGPDFAVVYFLGDKYATPWTQDRTIRGLHKTAQRSLDDATAAIPPLNAPFEKAVMSGRSIYYGALLYIGQLHGEFWLSVFVQGAVFLFLSYTLTVTCLGLSFKAFAVTTVAALLATSLPFYVSFLMPDIFAAFLILATIILTVFWERLTRRQRVIISAIILYCALTHTSHLLLLACLTLAFVLWSLAVRRKAVFSGPVLYPAAIMVALMFSGAAGEWAFLYGVKLVVGADPVRPPYMTGRLVQDGAGFRFLQQNCATKPYVICKFMDRLPTDINVFLWSKDPRQGIFNFVDLQTRTALSSEQVAFAWDVFKFDPVAVITAALGNLATEVRNIGLIEFFFTPETVQAYKQTLPDQYYGDLQHSHLIFRHWILTLGTVYAAIYYASAAILLLGLVVLPRLRTNNTFDGPDAAERQRWLSIFFIVLTATICNAAICGTLSGPFPRYQTRISWVPFFVLCLFVASMSAHLLPKKAAVSAAG